MEQDFRKSVFYRAFMTSVFTGIMCTVLSMIFDVMFKESTDFPFSLFINVSSLIFGINILFLVTGTIYYWSVRYSRAGEIIFVTFFVLLTFFLLLKVDRIHRTDDRILNIEFRRLLSGIVLIAGIGVSIVVPLLYHNKKFEKYVL